MNRKKYGLTDETRDFYGVTLHRIRALINISRHAVKAEKLGGPVDNEANLSHHGDVWISGDARVCENARVFGGAQVSGAARLMLVFKSIGNP